MLTHQRVSEFSHDQNINMCNKVFSFIPTNIIICSLFSIYIMFVFVFIVFVNVFCPKPPKRSPPPWLKLVTGKTNFLQSLVAAHQYLHPREILQFHKGEKLSNKSNKHCLLNRVSQIKSQKFLTKIDCFGAKLSHLNELRLNSIFSGRGFPNLLYLQLWHPLLHFL